MKINTFRARRRFLIYALTLGVFAFIGFYASFNKPASAVTGINQQMNFQGRLLNSQGATVPDGYYNVQFKIYQDGDGQSVGNTTGSPSGTLKWTESRLNANGNGVQVRNGFMSVDLGSVTAFGSSIDWNQSVLWLSMNIGSTNGSCTPFSNCSPDGEMVPMKRLSSTPYSLNSGQLGGLTSAQFLQLAQGVQTDVSNNTSSIFLNKTGTAGNFLQLQASGNDVFTLSSAGDISFGANANHTMSVATSAASTAGRNLTISAGTAGTGASALAGGDLVLQGGTGGGTNGNGGNVTIDAGAANGSGVAGTINIGTTNASGINLNQDTTVAAGKSLTITGSGTRPTGVDGKIYYDTTTDELLVYSNGKWQADSSDAILVAASNSSQTDKDAADYVADGTGDQTEINNALTAANPAGAGRKTGKVYLFAGTYTASATISIPNNTTLTGAGQGTLLQLADIDATDNLIENSDTTTGTGVTIQDIRLDGQDSLNTAGTQHGIYLNGMGDGSGVSARQGAKLTNVIVNNFRSNGIYLNNSDNNSFTAITTQANDYGYLLNASINNSVRNSSIFGNASYGAYLGSSSNNNVIANNKLTDNVTAGIFISSSSGNSVNGNNVKGTSGTGISLNTASKNTISGNVSMTNGYGFALSTSDDNTMSSNLAEGNSNTGFYLSSSSRNTLTGNTATASAVYGFYVVSSSSNNTINGNKIHDSGGASNNNGVYISASDANTITGNDITDTAATTNYAINILNNTSDKNYLADNIFSSTPATSTINDAGTGTIYANQSRAESGSQLTNRTADNTAAFTVQNASGANVLTADTANGEIEIGSASLAGKLVLSDGSSNTGTILLGALGGDYTYTIPTTTANDEFCLLTLGNCTAAGNYIQNQDASAQTANFWIDGTGKVAAGLQAPSLDTITAGTLSVGTSTATSVTVGKSAGTILLASATTTVGTSGTSTNLQAAAQTTTDTAGNSFTIQGAGGNGTGTGGSVTLAGGLAGGTSGANGGDITVTGGNGTGTGTKGLVKMGATSFTTATNAPCAADCTITQSYVDSNSTIIISSSGTDITITLPAPTNTTQGRLTYITTTTTSNDFTLAANSGGDLLSVTMRKNTTATMVWNGSAWTPGGASNAITLQATYNNGSNPSTTPEIKLDSVRGTIDIQDADTSIAADLLNIRGSNAGGLGTVLFGVSDTGRVTIQGTTDQNSAFRVLNATGDYLLNVNSANNYIVNNSIRSAGNEIQNPGLESGGAITSGEEGWFGSAQASIVNSAANANSGNYVLQVLPNGTNLDVFAGNYFEVKAGDSVYFEGRVKNSAGANGNGGIQITWYDKDKAVLSNSTAYPNLPGTSYVLRKINGTAPANTVYARVSATVRSNSTAGTFYFDDFYMNLSNEVADYTFRNREDSSTAFRIQSAGSSQTLLTANTTDNILKIGDSTGTDTSMTMLVLDSATADPTTLTNRNGGLFYRSDNNSLKAVIGGAVVDICTTAVTCTGYSASAGSSIQLQGSSPGTAQTGHFNITGTGIMTQLQTQDNASGSTQALVVRSGNATGGNSGNLTLDVGTATGTLGTITIGHSGVATTMAGTLKIQGANTLELGNSSSATASILFRTSAGANTVTLKGPSANPTSSYTLTLPTDLGGTGECIKTDATGGLYFQGCGVGVNFNLQDAYDNSGTPANVALADGKDFKITATDTSTTDPNVLINLACTTSCGSNGRFAIQNGGTDILSVLPNSGGIILNKYTQIGSATTDSTQVNFQLDSYNGTSDSGACSTTVNQGAIYYNTSMGSLRSCINGSWSDVSNPDTLGLLTFGIVPSSGGGSNAYDLPSLVNNGSSGPCKVSWASNNSVYIQACVAYSSGRRVNVASTTLYTNTATTNNTNLTTTNRFGHVCLVGSNNQPAFTSTSGLAAALNGLPTFSASSPILCLATVVGSATTGGLIDDIYDVRTFTSAMKEAVNASTALELGMIADAGSTGAMTPAVSASQKLYGAVVATDGATSAGAPNAIVTTVGPAWVKANAGTAGQFVKTSTTNGFANTISAIPNNSFYYSVGNTRTAWSTTCTASTNCAGSLYVNLIVR